MQPRASIGMYCIDLSATRRQFSAHEQEVVVPVVHRVCKQVSSQKTDMRCLFMLSSLLTYYRGLSVVALKP